MFNAMTAKSPAVMPAPVRGARNPEITNNFKTLDRPAMTCPGSSFAVLITSALLAVGLLAANPAWAVHKIGNIELDGNTVNDGAAVAGIDDWDDIYNGTGHALRSAFIVDSAVLDATVFDGGIKDTQSLDQWSCRKTGVQDKSNIQHAYGATYKKTVTCFSMPAPIARATSAIPTWVCGCSRGP